MSQSAASQKQFNPRTALISTALLAAFGVAGYSGMGMGTSSTPSAAEVADGILTDQHGMAFHMFDRGATADKSACNGKCAENQSPLAVDDTDKPPGDYTIITRNDGKKQWAYHGKPLYLQAKNEMPDGQIGDGFINVWHVAKPQARRPRSCPYVRSGQPADYAHATPVPTHAWACA